MYTIQDHEWSSLLAYMKTVALRHAQAGEPRDPVYYLDRCLDAIPQALVTWQEGRGRSLASWIRLKVGYALREPRGALDATLDEVDVPSYTPDLTRSLWWNDVLRHLPTRQRAVAQLLAQGYTAVEIAQRLGIKETAAHQRVLAIRRALRAAIDV